MDRFTNQRLAVTAVFAGNGALFASLYSRLPVVQERLRLDEGALGLALLAAPAGLILAVMVSGPLVARRGSRDVAAVGAAGYAALLFLPAIVPNIAWLALALFALGAASGALDVAMNTQGLAVEARAPRRIFASLHAGFSFGALAGAASAGLVAQAGVPLTAHLLATGTLVAALLALAIRRFAPDTPTRAPDPAPAGASAPHPRAAVRPPRAAGAAPAPPPRAPVRPPRAAGATPAPHPRPPRAADPSPARVGAAAPAAPPGGDGPTRPRAGLARAPRGLVGLGAVAFCVLLAEGALNDWSAVYLTRVHDAAPGTAASGLAVFSLTMGFARLAGDRLATAFGSRVVARGGLLAGACAFAAAAAAPSAPTAIAAFGALGLGLASVYPLTMRAAAARSDVPPSVAIGAVTTLGYVGFLLGPPAVGLLAHASSLRASLGAVGGLCVLAAWLARGVTDESTRRAQSEHIWECPPPAPSSAPISS